jgi:hypothetical protein
MQELFNVWQALSYVKIGTDLSLVTQGRKSPMQALFETSINELSKYFVSRAINQR